MYLTQNAGRREASLRKATGDPRETSCSGQAGGGEVPSAAPETGLKVPLAQPPRLVGRWADQPEGWELPSAGSPLGGGCHSSREPVCVCVRVSVCECVCVCVSGGWGAGWLRCPLLVSLSGQ